MSCRREEKCKLVCKQIRSLFYDAEIKVRVLIVSIFENAVVVIGQVAA